MRPNILHIFVDQQRFDTIGALGNPIIKTPHLDRLARQGRPYPGQWISRAGGSGYGALYLSGSFRI